MILRDLLHRPGAVLTAVLTAALISLTAVVLRLPVRASAGSNRAADRRFVLITPRLVRQGWSSPRSRRKPGTCSWAPDGTMREIKICRNGAQKNAGAAGQEPDFKYDVQAQSVTGGTVFDGIPLGKDAGLQQGPYRDSDDIPPATRTRTVAARPPDGIVQPAYSGPRRCDHPAHEGCLPRPAV